MNKKQIVLSVALALGCGLALAEEPEATGGGLVSVGAGWWSEDRPRWGVFDGMNEKGFYPLIDGSYARRDDATGTWFKFDARNLGLDTREFRADWLRQGDGGVFFDYNRIPRDNPYTFLTGLEGFGTSTQRVPATANPPLGEVHLGTVRERVGIGVFKSLGGGYDVRVTFNTEEKKGTRQWGRGGAAEFAVEPIDSTTRQIEAVLSYVSRAFQIQGGYHGSWYNNDIAIVDTALTNGTSQFFLSQPLDNAAHQLFANGGYNFSQSTRATFKAAYTRATQDDHIPVGAGVATMAGVPTSLDGRIDNTLLQAGLTSRATNDLSWLANLRYYKSEEKTPQQRFVKVASTGHLCDSATGTANGQVCVDTVPLTFETITAKLEATYRMAQGLSLTGGLEHSRQDRNIPVGNGTVGSDGVDDQRYVPFRAELDETTYRLQLRRSLSDSLNGAVGYAHSKRDGSEYSRTNEAESDEINPINIADRDRDKFTVMVDWMPVQPLTLTFNAAYAKDDYKYSDQRPYGLREGTATMFAVDAAYTLTGQWQLHAWYARDHTKAEQHGQRAATGTAGRAEKEAELEDIGNSLGLGVRGVLMPRVRVGSDVLYSRNVNRYPETVTLTTAGTVYPAGITGPLPDITNTLTRIKLYAVYALEKNSDIRLDYIHERWKTDDWSYLFADGNTFVYGTTTDGTRVVQGPRQISNFIGLRYIYRFL